MTVEDKILKVADQLAVVSRQRIGLEKNIADLKSKLKKKNQRRKLKSRSVAKHSRPEKTERSAALGAGYCMGVTELSNRSAAVTFCIAGPVIITFSLDRMAHRRKERLHEDARRRSWAFRSCSRTPTPGRRSPGYDPRSTVAGRRARADLARTLRQGTARGRRRDDPLRGTEHDPRPLPRVRNQAHTPQDRRS